MFYSGFYMANGHSKEDAISKVIKMYNDEISKTVDHKYGKNTFTIIEADRLEEYDDDETGECYDVHFVLNLPYLHANEETEAFNELENIICTGLGVCDLNTLEMDGFIMTYPTAMAGINEGKVARRKEWANDKYIFDFKHSYVKFPKDEDFIEEIYDMNECGNIIEIGAGTSDKDETFKIDNFILVKNKNGTCTPYFPSIEDQTALDWEFV